MAGTPTKVAIAVLAAGTIGAAGLTTQATGSGRTPRVLSQWEDPIWYCHPITSQGWAESKTARIGTWGPGGLRFYTVHWRVSAEKCKGRTRLRFYPYISAKSFPSDRSVIYQFQSAGRQRKFKAACMRYASGNRRCVWRVPGGHSVPERCCVLPVISYRQTPGRSRVRYAKMVHGAIQGDAWRGEIPASFGAHTSTLRLHWYRVRK